MLGYSFITSVYVSVVGSCTAWITGLFVLWKKSHSLHPLVGGLVMARTMLAFFYTCSQTWFLTHQDRLGAWVNFQFGVAIVAWIVAWSLSNIVLLFISPSNHRKS